MTTYETIKLTKDGAVATLTLNRPDKLNALNDALLHDVLLAFDELGGDAGVSVAILTGAGDKAFAAGADIGAMSEMTTMRAKAFAELGHEVGARIEGARFRNLNRGFAGPWRFGYPGWYGYYNPYFYDPYWLWDSSSYYDDSQDQQDQDVAQGYEMNGPGPEEQGAPDSYGENYNGGGDQDAYAQSAPYEPRHAELTAPSAPTTLIFRDQHKEEIQNYAIVGNMLFSFSAERTQKIPLSDLDIPATTKVNEDRGVNFRIPGEGQ